MNGSEARVLIVDDSPVNVELLRVHLTRLGHRAEAAADGRDALCRLHEGAFDACLLDLMMPEVDGFAVLRQVRADPALRDLPVLVVSALTDKEPVVRAIELGADDYLLKPVDGVMLRARLGACLERKRWRDQEARYRCELEGARDRAESLLSALLPGPVIDELRTSGRVRPREHPDVAVLFADVVDFTQYCAAHPPAEVHAGLERLMEACEDLADAHGLTKIKTIGDAFMAAGGLLAPLPNAVLAAVRCGMEMVAAATARPPHWALRVGIHVGAVSAGVVGRRTYLYDIWGDTVNTAARAAGVGPANAVTVTEAAYARLAGAPATAFAVPRVKGKGSLNLYSIEAL